MADRKCRNDKIDNPNEDRFVSALLERHWVDDVKIGNDWMSGNITVTTNFGETFIVEYTRRKVDDITQFDRWGGMSLGQNKVDRILSRSADGHYWVVEDNNGTYWWADLQAWDSTGTITRRKPRANGAKSFRDTEPCYNWKGENMKDWFNEDTAFQGGAW